MPVTILTQELQNLKILKVQRRDENSYYDDKKEKKPELKINRKKQLRKQGKAFTLELFNQRKKRENIFILEDLCCGLHKEAVKNATAVP